MRSKHKGPSLDEWIESEGITEEVENLAKRKLSLPQAATVERILLECLLVILFGLLVGIALTICVNFGGT